ncbi:unnamed protein product, partial [Mesorhabditis belari]|uniref:ENTH domain-containing protein n=1 Tax=Mesorhabditis belari TaxID=2138241 RepID=A0AAF3F3T9_9BILA
MQTIEKALHQPMPFTTGGQTISDRLNAAKHSLAGSQLGKTICKATTEELMAPKKKHLDYLLHCTNEPNVSIPSMANLLIERTQNPNWTVVYKSLITIHNIMCYGNERFSQYLASCNTTFNLGNFLDKNSTQGYDMSQHVRRYGKYIGEKIATYRVCAFDFCKVKRGREDGLLRTMHTDKLLSTLPILQNQINALLEFQVNASELSNGVINCSFILLFRDLIRLFACYNDGMINLLEKYFDMNKKQCRNALDTYKSFLNMLDKVSEFLRVAESVGIDKTEIPDLTRAPASLLEALESHLHHLEGGRGPPPGSQPPPQIQQFSSAAYGAPNVGGVGGGAQTDMDRQKYIEMEKERMKQFENQRQQGGPAGAAFNPFATGAAVPPGRTQKATDTDLVDLFAAPIQQQPAIDPSNPFAAFGAPVAQNQSAQQQQHTPFYQQQPSIVPYGGATSYGAPVYTNGTSSVYPSIPSSSATFSPDFSRAFAIATTSTTTVPVTQGMGFKDDTASFNPFAIGTAATQGGQWAADFGQQQGQDLGFDQGVHGALPGNANPFGVTAPPNTAPPAVETVQPQSGISAQSSTASTPLPIAGANLGIYENTPFSRMDGSYTTQSMFDAQAAPQTQPNPQDQTNVDSALSSLASNLTISGAQNDVKPVQWSGMGQPARPNPPVGTSTYNPSPMAFSQPPAYGAPNYGMPAYGGAPAYGQPQMWPQMGMQGAPGMYGMQQQPAYGGQPGAYGYPQQGQPTAQVNPQAGGAADTSNPFGNPFS